MIPRQELYATLGRGPRQYPEAVLRQLYPHGIPLRELPPLVYPADCTWEALAQKLTPRANDFWRWWRETDLTSVELQNNVHNLTVDFFVRSGLTLVEVIWIYLNIAYSGTLTDSIQCSPFFSVVHKIKSSYWRWGRLHSVTDTELIRAWEFLQNFDFGEGFTVTLDQTVGYNESGRVIYSRIEKNLDGRVIETSPWSDGSFMFVVWRGGQRVLHIGFSFAPQGILISQIQMVNKKGNRWLYKLKLPVVDYVVQRFLACAKCPIWIVEPGSLAAKIREAYGADLPHSFHEVEERLRRTYQVATTRSEYHCFKLLFRRVAKPRSSTGT